MLGPNGAGKSTLLRALAGLVPLDARSHRHRRRRGRRTGDATRTSCPERRPVGVVFQDYLLFPHLTVLENVAFGLRSRGIGRAEARRRAGEWLERVGLRRPRRREAARRSPAVSSSASRWHARSSPSRGSCCSTSRSPRSTSAPAPSCGATCAHTSRRSPARGCSSPTSCSTRSPSPIGSSCSSTGASRRRAPSRRSPTRPRSRYVADLVGMNLLRGTAQRPRRSRLEGGGVVVTADAGRRRRVRRHPAALGEPAPRHSPRAAPRNVWRGRVRRHRSPRRPGAHPRRRAGAARRRGHRGRGRRARPARRRRRLGEVKATELSTSTRSEPAPRARAAGREGVPRAGQRLHVGGERGQRQPARGRCRRRGRGSPTGAIGCSEGCPVCTTMMRVAARCSWTSCSRSSSRVSMHDRGRGRRARRVTTAVRRAERLAERRCEPAGGAGGEQHLLGRRLGDHVVVVAPAPPRTRRKRRTVRGRVAGVVDDAHGGLDSVGGGEWFHPARRRVRPRCGDRENSTRTRGRSGQPRELLDRVVRRHGRAGRTDEQLVAQVPAVEELEQLLVVGAVVGEHERLERGVALLPRRRVADRGTRAGRRGRPRCTRRRSRRSAADAAPGGTRCAAGGARTRRRGRGCAATARGARAPAATGERTRFGHLDRVELLDAEDLGERLDREEVRLAGPLHVGHVVGRGRRRGERGVERELVRQREREVVVHDRGEVDRRAGVLRVLVVEHAHVAEAEHRVAHAEGGEVHHRVADVAELEVEDGGDATVLRGGTARSPRPPAPRDRACRPGCGPSQPRQNSRNGSGRTLVRR